MLAIHPGEQVTISYTDLLQTLDERQQSLLQRYAFTCCCERCQDDSPMPGDWFLDAVAADGTSLSMDKQVALLLSETLALLCVASMGAGGGGGARWGLGGGMEQGRGRVQ